MISEEMLGVPKAQIIERINELQAMEPNATTRSQSAVGELEYLEAELEGKLYFEWSIEVAGSCMRCQKPITANDILNHSNVVACGWCGAHFTEQEIEQMASTAQLAATSL